MSSDLSTSGHNRATPPPSSTASGSRPAEITSRPEASGTSGRRTRRNPPPSVPGPATPQSPTANLIDFGLPDVPDEGDLGAGHVPDACRTVPDGRQMPENSAPANGPNGTSAHPAGGAPGISRPTPLTVRGILRMGRMRSPRDRFELLENVDFRELLRREVPPDTVIEAEPGAQISIVDADTHHWPEPPDEQVLRQHLFSVFPAPDAAWISHGRGIKLAYVGPHHRERSLAAAFSVPCAFHLELLTHTRHPQSVSSQHDGARCGDVEFFDNDVAAEFNFQTVGPLTPDQRAEALASVDMRDGGRYDHDRCPIEPGTVSDAQDCVVVLDTGIYCHRCAARRNRYAPHLRPGFVPFRSLVINQAGPLDELAGHLVHWTHALFVLSHRFPHLAPQLLEQAYRHTLRSRWGGDDPRVAKIFHPDLDFVWSDGVWLDSKSLQPTQVDNDAASGLPCVYDVVPSTESRPELVLDPVRRAQVKHRTPRGYPPIRPVRGIILDTDHRDIPVIVPPEPRHPVELLFDPMPIEEANHQLERHFPRLSTRYLHACLAAAICAGARRGQPSMLVCTGPSGSGKEQHIRLAASFMGEDIVKLALTEDDEKFMRNIGMAVAAGRRFLVFDELGKIRKLSTMSRMLLQISGNVTWRPLYANHYVHTQIRSAFFFPCVRFPETLTTSQEFCRRTRRAHLHHRVLNWAETSGGDTAEWRDRSPENALIANSVLTHIWRTCHEFEFRFS